MNRKTKIAATALSVFSSNPTLTPAKCIEHATKFVDEIDKYLAPVTLDNGAVVKCIDNKMRDEGYTGCEELSEGDIYTVKSQGSNPGFIRVELADGELSDDLYGDRFEVVSQ